MAGIGWAPLGGEWWTWRWCHPLAGACGVHYIGHTARGRWYIGARGEPRKSGWYTRELGNTGGAHSWRRRVGLGLRAGLES